MKRITLKGLAKILDVSVSTVSKALNDSHEISDETKKKVKEFAKKYNYQPNQIAVNLKSGKTKTIGVVVPSVRNFFFAQVIKGIELAIADTGYNMIVSITAESLDKEQESISSLANGLVDGFIVAISEETSLKQSFDHFQNAIDENKHLVMFDRVVKSIDCDKVIGKDYNAINDVTKRLKVNGRKNIVVSTTIANVNVGKERIKGYTDVVNNPVIIDGDEDINYKKLFDFCKTKPVDAIMALDLEASLNAMRVCRELNINVPKDIAIVGYASRKMADNIVPSLTTIDQNGISIGKAAAETLLKRFKKVPSKNTTIVVESTLNRRASF